MKIKELFTASFRALLLVAALTLCGSAANAADRAVTVKAYETITIKVGEVVDVYCDKAGVVDDFWDASMNQCWVDHAWVMFPNNTSDPSMDYLKVSNTGPSLGQSTCVGLAESPKAFRMRMYYSLTWTYPGDNTKYVAQGEYTFYVKVVDDGPKELTKITLPETKSLKQGETATLSPTLSPSGATNKLTWKSSNAAVVAVDDNGKITAVKAGKARVTVTSDNGLSAYCDVTVQPAVTGVKIEAQTTKVQAGYGLKLEAKLLPEGASSSVIWIGDNDKVGAVTTYTGYVTTYSPGTVKITVKTSEGFTDTVELTVTEPVVGTDARNVSEKVSAVRKYVDKCIKKK